jgi:hypothetical protein
MNPSGQVVEVEGTVEEVTQYMRRTGGTPVRGQALSGHAPRQILRNTPYESYDSDGYDPPEVLEGVVVEEAPRRAVSAGRPEPVSLVDEYELSRYFRSGW